MYSNFNVKPSIYFLKKHRIPNADLSFIYNPTNDNPIQSTQTNSHSHSQTVSLERKPSLYKPTPILSKPPLPSIHSHLSKPTINSYKRKELSKPIQNISFNVSGANITSPHNIRTTKITNNNNHCNRNHKHYSKSISPIKIKETHIHNHYLTTQNFNISTSQKHFILINKKYLNGNTSVTQPKTKNTNSKCITLSTTTSKYIHKRIQNKSRSEARQNVNNNNITKDNSRCPTINLMSSIKDNSIINNPKSNVIMHNVESDKNKVEQILNELRVLRLKNSKIFLQKYSNSQIPYIINHKKHKYSNSYKTTTKHSIIV
jgi:hypothetical protein